MRDYALNRSLAAENIGTSPLTLVLHWRRGISASGGPDSDLV